MKAILISINPRWCELIASGKKTVEVRKTRPKLETPFKVYIYCTQGDSLNYLRVSSLKPKFWIDNEAYGSNVARANGKVIGEFVCDRIIHIPCKDLYENFRRLTHDIITPSCLKVKELEEYLGTKDGYGWHISSLVIYDKPRELSEFYVWKKCNSCRDTGYESTACMYDENCKVPAIITRPPQSWCYVESEDTK